MKHYILHIILISLSLLMPTGCSIMDEGPDAAGTEGNMAQVAFTLKVEGTDARTRTTWGSTYFNESGNSYENHIDPASLQVVIYGSGNASYPLQSLYREGSSTGEYTFVGNIDLTESGLTSGEYKIMVFANCPTNENFDNLAQLSYSYTHSADPTTYIPMWGVTTATLELKAGERQTLTNPIDLLRAMAKVEVKLSGENVTDYKITGVTISRSNTQGYCLPKDYDKVATTGELDREEGTGIITFNPYTGSPVTEDIAFTEENGTYILYLPEYDNTGTGTSPAQISVTVKGANETEETYTLEFKEYSEGIATGEAFDIVRNHIYRYNITGIDNGKLTVQHRVMPWDKVSSTIEFTENVTCTLLPEGGNANSGTSGDAEAVYCILYRPSRPDGSLTTLRPNLGTATALYEFTFDGPEGTVWTAHLSNEEVFTFSPSIDGDHRLVSTGIARKEPYYIQINLQGGHNWVGGGENGQFENAEALNQGWGDQVEATHELISTYFYITISTDGIHEEELVINPPVTDETIPTLYSYGGSRRRFAGTDTRIWIRQVPTMYGWNIGQMAEPADPTDTGTNPWDNYYWWRVNPYWNPTANARALMENANETE